MSDEKEKYRLHLLKKQSTLSTKIEILKKEYEEIDKELDRTASKSRKSRKSKNKKSKKRKQDDEGGCSIM